MRAGLIEQLDILESAKRSITSKKVTAFIGAHRSGKSTFLEIIEEKLRAENFKSLKVKVSLGATTSNLIREITGQISTDLRAIADELHVESFLRYLNSNKIILMLDDFQNVTDPDQFIEGMLDRLTAGRLILSATSLPSISKDRIFEMGIVRARSFNLDEVAKLSSSISIPSTTSEVMPAIEMLHHLSGGAPELIKLTLGDLYASGLSLTLKNIETAFDLALAERLLRITRHVCEPTKRALTAASFVKFETRIEHQIISNLEGNETRQLLDLGLIISEDNRFELQHKDLWRNLNSDSSTFRVMVLESAKSFSGFPSVREQIYQLKALEDWPRLVETFDATILECESFWTYDEIANLTEGMLDHLSTHLMGLRATALRAIGKAEMSLGELEFYSRKQLSPQDRRWIEYQILRSKSYANNRDNLYSGYLRLYKESTPDERTYYRALCWCLYFSEQLNTGIISGAALETLYNSTIELVSKKLSTDKVFLAQTHTDFAFAFGRQEMALQRNQCLDAALRLFSEINPAGFDTLFLQIMIVEAKNETHISRKAKISFRLREEARLLGLRYLAIDGAYIEAYYATSQGRPEYSLNYLRKTWQSDLDRIPLAHLSQIGAALHSWLLKGDVLEAHTYLKNKLEMLDAAADNFIMYALVKSLHCFDYLASHSQKAQPTISPEEKITGHNIHALANMLALLDLHSYYQFDQIVDRVIERIDWNSKAHLRAIALSQPHFAWRELLAGRLKIADKHFNSAVELSRREEMYFYQFRSLSGMIVMALQEDQLSKARDLLAEAKSIAPLMDPVENLPELYLLPILEAFYLIRAEQKQAARDFLQTTNKFKRYEFLRQSLLNELGINTRDEVYNPGSSEKKFSERLLELAKIKLQSRYEFRDHLATHSILEEMPKLHKGYDFVWDRMKGELLVGRENFELHDKPLIEELLYFLVCHPNESYTKEQLIGFVWRENYNPLVHDSRIYTSIKRIRQMFSTLGDKEVVIQDAGRYGISRDAKFAVISRASHDLPILPRQKWVIEFVDQNGTIDRLTAEKVLHISSAQVKRDLKDLVDRGFLSIDGNGRAAKYIRGRTR